MEEYKQVHMFPLIEENLICLICFRAVAVTPWEWQRPSHLLIKLRETPDATNNLSVALMSALQPTLASYYQI
jgi:hypothetical protein